MFSTNYCGTDGAIQSTETVFQWVENLEFCKGGEQFRGLPFTHCLVTQCGTLYKMHRHEKGSKSPTNQVVFTLVSLVSQQWQQYIH